MKSRLTPKDCLNIALLILAVIVVIIMPLLLSGCSTVKNTYVYIEAHHSAVTVEATTKGSDAEDSLNGNTPSVELATPLNPLM